MAASKKTTQTGFVAMPISDPDGYEAGHFRRVYEFLIKPACIEAGFEPDRADDSASTNVIVLEVLRRILSADLMICDLSSRNPNVFYELGVRQAFDLPVVLLSDSKTKRVFDVQGIRTVQYDVNLRIDSVTEDRSRLRRALSETAAADGQEINSMVRLLGISKAEPPATEEVSGETSLILNGLKDVLTRLTALENRATWMPGTGLRNVRSIEKSIFERLPNGELVEFGYEVYEKPGGELIGTFIQEIHGYYTFKEIGSDNFFVVRPDDPRYGSMSTIPPFVIEG